MKKYLLFALISDCANCFGKGEGIAYTTDTRFSLKWLENQPVSPIIGFTSQIDKNLSHDHRLVDSIMAQDWKR